MSVRITTLGHSNRTIDQLIELLRAHDIELLIDIRRVPRSGRNPQFNSDSLAIDLPNADVRYRSVPDLGGRRSRATNTPHVALTDPAIAGYADYMDTAQFAEVGAKLIDVASRYRTAIMCAEAKPQSCHRRLLCDWLLANDVDVVHALDATTSVPHRLDPSARITERAVVYDCRQLDLVD